MILLLIIMDSRTKCLTVPLLMGNLFDETGDRHRLVGNESARDGPLIEGAVCMSAV